MRTTPFIYNPSQDIQKAGKDVSGGIEQAFAREIQNREQFFNTTTKFIENIESYKKNLNQFNYKAISEKADQLIKDVAGSIKSKGKIDSDALFGLREKMTEIRNAKEQSDMIPKIIEENVKRARDKGSYIRDPQKYYNELLQLAENKDLLFSATTFESAANKLYSKNLDYGRIINDKLKAYSDVNIPKDRSTRGTFTDDKGGVFNAEIKVQPFFDVDSTGNQVPKFIKTGGGGSIEAYKGVLESLLSPEEIEGFKEYIVGSAIAFDGNISARLNDMSRDFFEAQSGYNRDYKMTPLQAKKAQTDITKNEQDISAFDREQERKDEALDLSRQSVATSRMNTGIAAQRLELAKQELEQKKNEPQELPRYKLNSDGKSLSAPLKFNNNEYDGVSRGSGGALTLYRNGKKIKVITDVSEMNKLANSQEKELSKVVQSLIPVVTPKKATGTYKAKTSQGSR